jgi:hypothetical protein
VSKLFSSLAILATAFGSLWSQPVTPLFTDAGAFVHQITVGNGINETRFRQAVSPISLSLPIAMGNLRLQSAYLYIEQRDSTGTLDASGPLDTQVTGEWTFGRVALSGYANIATGMDSLDMTEFGLARDMSRSDLDFPIKTFGQGLDFGGAITLGHCVENWALSAGGGYIVRGTYSPDESVSEYDPGNELTLTAGASYASKGWTIGLDAAAKLIYIDRLAGEALFRNGKQMTARGSLSYSGQTLRIDTSVTEIIRMKNRKISDGILLYEDRDSNGNDLRAKGKVSLTPFEGLTVFGEAQLKDVTENSYDAGDPLFLGAARLWSYGGGVSVTLGGTETLTLRVRRGDGWLNDRLDDIKTLNAHVAVRLFF